MKRCSADIQLINGHKAKKRARKEESKNETFTADSNSVGKFHIVDTNRDSISDMQGASLKKNNQSLVPFSPFYTHQIFSSNEKIRGYNGLKVDMHLSGATLKCYLQIRYNKRAKKYDDVEKLLSKHFGDHFTTDPNQFQDWMDEDLEHFKPPGKKVYEFDRIQDKHRHYEVYKINLNDKKFSPKLNRSLQAMLFFYIESASFIEKDPCWNYFLLYEVVKKFKNNPTSYRLIGYSTTYESLKGKRAYNRISQFLILPSYQKQCFGKGLVEGIYDHYMKESNGEEINVEKPTNAFKRLRDSIEEAMIIKKGYVKQIDNIVHSNSSSAAKDLSVIVLKIHSQLKISNSRIIKILQNHYGSKQELVYKHGSQSKNCYKSFKHVISQVKTMLSSLKGVIMQDFSENKESNESNSSKKSKQRGRQGMKNPKKAKRANREEEVKVSTMSTSSLIESRSSDQDSEWQSPDENSKVDAPKSKVIRKRKAPLNMRRKSNGASSNKRRVTKRAKINEEKSVSRRSTSRFRKAKINSNIGYKT